MPQLSLYKMRCQELLANLHGCKVDSYVTSPPYNVGCDYDVYFDKQSRSDYLADMRVLARLANERSHKNTVFWLQMGPNRQDPSLPFEVLDMFSHEGWRLVNQIVWLKSGTFPQLDGSEASFGHFRPIQSPTILHRCWEWVFMLVRGEKNDVKLDKLALGVPYKDISNVARFNHAQDIRCRGDVWYVPYSTTQKQAHPCAFPVALAENCLKLQGLEPNSLVMDPFCGTGATLRAAGGLGHRAIGCDLSHAYLEVAQNRLKTDGYDAVYWLE